MIIFICIVLILLLYYLLPPKVNTQFIGLNGAIVKVEKVTFNTIVVCYKVGSGYSNPMNLSRFYFKTNFIRWKT